jgi:hypothetical protein
MFDSAYRLIKQVGRVFFSEEKKQKTLILRAANLLAPDHTLAAGEETKVFWFFSSEKNALLHTFRIKNAPDRH